MRGFRRFLLLAVCLDLGAALGAAEAARPNIFVILSDDMGYSDLGCYGGEIATPNLDALASSGVRFTQFYNAARCCPTRASLLTGLYPHQAGVGHMTEGPGLRRLSGRPQSPVGDDPRSAPPGGLSDLHVREVARLAVRRPRRRSFHLAPGPRVREVLWHHRRRGEFLRPDDALPSKQGHHRGERPRIPARVLLLHRRPVRQRGELPPPAPGRDARQAVLPLRRLHRGPLADARPGGGDRQIQGAVRLRIRAGTRGPGSVG